MSLDKNATTDEFLADLREKEAARKERFPGYPAYLEDRTLEEIEGLVEMYAEGVDEDAEIYSRKILVARMRCTLIELAQRVAHSAAGCMALEQSRRSDQATTNMINGVFAGMGLKCDLQPNDLK